MLFEKLVHFIYVVKFMCNVLYIEFLICLLISTGSVVIYASHVMSIFCLLSFSFVNIVRSLSLLLIFSKNQFFVSSIFFCFQFLIVFAIIFIISFFILETESHSFALKYSGKIITYCVASDSWTQAILPLQHPE